MKAKIFCGAARTGKTRVAKMISEHVGKDKTVFIEGREIHDNPFVFSGCTSETKLLIIEDCLADFDYFLFGELDYRGDERCHKILKQERGKEPEEILIPQIIFITEEIDREIMESGASYRARFEIIDFPLTSK